MEMTKGALIVFSCESKKVSVDEPFNAPDRRNRIVFEALRHAASKKIFGLAYVKKGVLYLDLKCNSESIEELVDMMPYILPGQHFSKKHWITLDISQVPSKEVLEKLIDVSYQLTD
ncbi:MmcQ/YjbR family DNA-binding protein [Levilactobacillus huananensis]|uniref:MmcQ/YjbR family DNA-binding protein n=1 Tax=Levilactobacillus huananensis TaxID=2486019 RepID=UPI000F76BC92|nr:MmcQ/YjbR family DNA-binding protein [Levilactobacillus huananensis]